MTSIPTLGTGVRWAVPRAPIRLRTVPRRAALIAAAWLVALSGAWAQPGRGAPAPATATSAAPLPSGDAPPECIAPAKPGGGFDQSCKLAQAAFQQAGLTTTPMRISYMPGGVGAIAFDQIVTRRPAEPRTLVAFSSGSLLNLSHGRFGKRSVDDVRWIAAVGVDFGVVLVGRQSPWKTLPELLVALKADPGRISFAAGGTIGSQDWVKSALVAGAGGVDHKSMRFVAFEGGGEAIAALKGGHVQVYMGDASEVFDKLGPASPFRALAVLAEQRLPGPLAGVPTAREQGVDIVWPAIRGFYVGPKVSDGDVAAWTAAFDRLMAAPAFDEVRARHGLFPLALTGPALRAVIDRQNREYVALATRFGLKR
ncbi:Bug family tripartite tricarboxylate transporter substrate binding protein [Roseateles chitinivorans]|uniref:Bug family tripartite tricarboxylate transporter substrate binding protein n=1 Tax=Roseateles chitinivorans TaxID=2917965 RepID=UPI003D676184